MALSPEISIEEVDETEEIPLETILLAQKTYRFDFEKKRLTSELISGLEAVRQHIMMALNITRYAHAIFSADTGNELHDVISNPDTTPEYKMTEIERVVKEAIIYDERIRRVFGFEIEYLDDTFQIAFQVDTVAGILAFEEVLTPNV
ncbi:DUF2634 domain-containing protein [Domibacillus tundrae]|uniref:DUF2634 domain-containing protein n=1 Tax=Domibacillus tundrae TaxID=1587527 RepID=UPI00061823B8|nr:DUF2634 domain-containing protein [Domibacillus tundrae]